MELLNQVKQKIRSGFFQVINIDSTIIAQAPRLSQYIDQMEQNIARVLDLEPTRVNVKATTTESLGFEGRGEGISALAIASVTEMPGVEY